MRVADEICKIASLEQKRLTLQKQCEGDQALQQEKEINQAVMDIKKLKNGIQDEGASIPQKLQQNIDEALSTAVETLKLTQLEQERFKLQKLCEGEKALQRGSDIDQAIKQLEALKKKATKATKATEELQLKINESKIIAEKILKLAPLEQKRIQLHILCKEGKVLPRDQEINQTIKDIKKLTKELQEEGIIIPEDMKMRIEKDFLVSEELRNK